MCTVLLIFQFSQFTTSQSSFFKTRKIHSLLVQSRQLFPQIFEQYLAFRQALDTRRNDQNFPSDVSLSRYHRNKTRIQSRASAFACDVDATVPNARGVSRRLKVSKRGVGEQLCTVFGECDAAKSSETLTSELHGNQIRSGCRCGGIGSLSRQINDLTLPVPATWRRTCYLLSSNLTRTTSKETGVRFRIAASLPAAPSSVN
ncbi:uncharacterized protein LOC144476834 isoform X2 [Augochlora pura]